jgi:2'-5' RNA ligase
MRLFIAINFNEATKQQLLTLRDELRSQSKGRVTLPENLHLTLAFSGECNEKQTEAIKSVLTQITFDPFDLTINQLGRFQRNGKEIWWAGIQETKPLFSLQSSLTDKLIKAGFTVDKRKYSPHITLGREVVTNILPCHIEPFGEAVKSIDLMKSEQINKKLTYTVIHSNISE